MSGSDGSGIGGPIDEMYTNSNEQQQNVLNRSGILPFQEYVFTGKNALAGPLGKTGGTSMSGGDGGGGGGGMLFNNGGPSDALLKIANADSSGAFGKAIAQPHWYPGGGPDMTGDTGIPGSVLGSGDTATTNNTTPQALDLVLRQAASGGAASPLDSMLRQAAGGGGTSPLDGVAPSPGVDPGIAGLAKTMTASKLGVGGYPAPAGPDPNSQATKGNTGYSSVF